MLKLFEIKGLGATREKHSFYYHPVKDNNKKVQRIRHKKV